MEMRYRLQRKEPFVYPNILGNHSMPVHSFRWKDIAAARSREDLIEYAYTKMRIDFFSIEDKEYRIIDTHNTNESEV